MQDARPAAAGPVGAGVVRPDDTGSAGPVVPCGAARCASGPPPAPGLARFWQGPRPVAHVPRDPPMEAAVHPDILHPRALLLALALLAAQPTAGADAATPMPSDAGVVFLHHSTGSVIWEGGVPEWFTAYNAAHGTHYAITELPYPNSPYPWDNYPYDYWNIWVNHAGGSPYQGNAPLELLTQQYRVIVFKHCFPVSSIYPDTGHPDVTSAEQTTENYKAQYEALKTKLRSFPSTRFVVWTGAALREAETTADKATRAKAFFAWVRDTWDEPGDNIYVWDFFALETDGGMYLAPDHASGDSHPNGTFAAEVAPLFGQRVVDVIEGRGDSSNGGSGDASTLAFVLAGANPFAGPVSFGVTLPSSARVTLDVFDATGRRVTRVKDEVLDEGTTNLSWDPGDQASGVYFARLRSLGHELTRRVVLAK
jgi:hypothetical protein